ncbi:MAG: hypothetical protein QOI73_1267 [Solirubrobacteraceae bacterium]|nr:hypothetical protein [Solirubrobacteraceae bacterium]
MRRFLIVAVTGCTLALLGGGAAASAAPADTRPVRPAADISALGTERLSDELRLTRFANAVALAPVRRRPSIRAPRVGRLRYLTEDGPLETYIALESRVGAAQRTWVRIRMPGRPNGRTGWVNRDDLGPLISVTTMLRVSRSALRATLYRRGRRVWSSRVGVGKAATPTPAGRYWIRTRIKGMGGGGSYGPWAFGTAAYSRLSDWPGGGVIGIHGTDEPQLIPGRPSHGCIRVPNPKIRSLARRMPIGTPVRIV